MHNLGTVMRFEIVRTLKKKSFWITSLLFPLMLSAVFGIIIFSNKATEDSLNDMESQVFSFAVTDSSDLINKDLLTGMKAGSVESKLDGIDKVKRNKLDAYFYYPEDLAKDPVEIYAKDAGIFDNSRYSIVANMLLDQSISSGISKSESAVLRDAVSFDSKTYRSGEEYNAFRQMIVPGVFLVLFYILIAVFGGQMLTSTTEEKENRVIEMILTTVRAKTLIVGKILSLILLGFVQIFVVIVPIVVGYFVLRGAISLPAIESLDLATIPIDPYRIGLGFVIFFLSFLVFTGLLVTIGAATPTAKEAGGFLGVVMMLIFGPLYAAPLFISDPEAPIVQFLSYFPLTAPIPLLLRNAVGNLELWQALIAIAILAITTVVMLNIAVRVFKRGVMEYSRKLSFKEIFKIK